MILVHGFLWFIIYSMMGWIYETTLCSTTGKKFVNRGFLNGPLCPIYGTGAVACILFLDGHFDHIALLFIAGMILTCTIEYITSVILEKLFDTRWWDYSQRAFNINGRVCGIGAIVFGTLSVLLIEFMHPFVSTQLNRVSDLIQIILASIIFIIMSYDMFVTIRHLVTLNGHLQEFQLAINNFMENKGTFKSAFLEQFEESEFYTERIKSIIKRNFNQTKRLTKAFPRMRRIKNEEAWQNFKNILQRQHKK